jgi:hypothetical protein
MRVPRDQSVIKKFPHPTSFYPLEFMDVFGDDETCPDLCVWLASVSVSFGWESGLISVANGAGYVEPLDEEATGPLD